MRAPEDERTFTELMSTLLEQVGVFVRKEFELAVAEMTTNVSSAAGHAARIAAGAVLLHAGLLIALAAAVMALIRVGVEPWVATTGVAALCLVAGYGLVTLGLRRIKTATLRPARTIETLEETVA